MRVTTIALFVGCLLVMPIHADAAASCRGVQSGDYRAFKVRAGGTTCENARSVIRAWFGITADGYLRFEPVLGQHPGWKCRGFANDLNRGRCRKAKMVVSFRMSSGPGE